MRRIVPISDECTAQEVYNHLQTVIAELESDTLDLNDIILLLAEVRRFMIDNHEVE